MKNVRYTGLIRWNTSEWIKDPDTGKRIRRSRPRSEWLEYRDESLRIISDELFQKVQKRSQDIANPDGRLKRGGKVKYLLSGLLKCGECGANYILTSKTSYQCSGSVGGACANKVRVRRDHVEKAILDLFGQLLPGVKQPFTCLFLKARSRSPDSWLRTSAFIQSGRSDQ